MYYCTSISCFACAATICFRFRLPGVAARAGTDLLGREGRGRSSISNTYAMDWAFDSLSCYYRSGFDLSLPLVPGKLFPEYENTAATARKYFATFKVCVRCFGCFAALFFAGEALAPSRAVCYSAGFRGCAWPFSDFYLARTTNGRILRRLALLTWARVDVSRGGGEGVPGLPIARLVSASEVTRVQIDRDRCCRLASRECSSRAWLGWLQCSE